MWDPIQANALGGGPLSSITNLAGSKPAITTTSTRNTLLFEESIRNKFVKWIKIWHLIWGITLWKIWIERNDRVVNQRSIAWVQDEITQVEWMHCVCHDRVGEGLKYFRTSPFSTEVLLERFRQSMGHERPVDQLELGLE